MAELVQNRRLFPVIILPVTSASQNFPKFQENLLVFFVPDAIASTIMIYDDIRVFIVKLNRVFSLSLYMFTVNCALQNKTSFQLKL